MPGVTVREITKFIEAHIPEFHRKRLESLASLKLQKVLRRKNPYLYKAKFVTSAPELVKVILDAHLSSQEEAIFGGFLEELAVFICERVFSGKKSSAEGIDLEFDRDGIRMAHATHGPAVETILPARHRMDVTPHEPHQLRCLLTRAVNPFPLTHRNIFRIDRAPEPARTRAALFGFNFSQILRHIEKNFPLETK